MNGFCILALNFENLTVFYDKILCFNTIMHKADFCVCLIFILCLPCIYFELFPHVLPSTVQFNFHFVCDPSQSEILLYSCIHWSHHNKSPCMASCNPLLHIVWKLPCISTSFYSIQAYLCVCVPYPFFSTPPGTQLNAHYIIHPATSF